MRLPPFFSVSDRGLRASIPFASTWLGVVVLILLAVRASAAGLPVADRLPDLGAPAGTIVDSDVLTNTVWTLSGSPYHVIFDSDGIQVAEGAVLTVEPGVEVQFDSYASLIVLGTLKAIGTEAQPILFTGATKEPGSWLFLIIESTSWIRNQGSVLRHVTIEYAQWNLMVQTASVHLSDCVLRHASEAGLWASLAGVVVEGCQIVDNGTYGIENSFGSLILAANNWWGDASGPYHELCNPIGAGDTVEDTYAPRVIFQPFLTSPDQEPAPVAASDALRLSLAPQRWFAPADGVTLISVRSTLRDGAGRPLPGRTVRLQTDLGTASGAGITDANGEAVAYINSDTPGDAILTGLVESSDDCECVAGPEALVTFGEYVDDPLLPGAEAPYMNGLIQVDPRPIVQGVPSTVSALLTNPNPYSIEVNATFSYSEYGVGLPFAPLGGVEDVRIEANSDREIGVPWTPLVSGHVCLRLDYVFQPAALAGAGIEAVGSGQTNFSIQPGPLGSPGTEEDGDEDGDPDEGDPESEKDNLKKIQKVIERINDGQMALDAIASPENIPGMAIPNLLFSYIMDFNLESWTTATAALGGDPPRQDYDVYATLESYTFTPLVSGEDLSAARAAAGNALMQAMLDLTAQMRAAALSLDRYAGAANANDLYWASEQAAWLIYYKQESGATMLEVADRLDALLDVMLDEGVEDLTVSVATVEAYQARLAGDGFSADEIAAAESIGLTDAEIEAIRQARIGADPEEVAGSVVTRLRGVAAALRPLGEVFMDPPNFDEGVAVGTTGASLARTNLARIFAGYTAFQVGNPLPDAATVELRVRTLDLPPDWMVSVSPASVDLAPGEQVTGVLTLRPGLAAVQGTRPRVAVEGYIDDELIGGIVIDVMVPRHAVGGPVQRVYLPLVVRAAP
ncbi:MAG TPA: Ig-like domain-containing protein [Anaerolineae bacterium]|nr:Ig-like domain-containing protein [Anaerolineae bacterium]